MQGSLEILWKITIKLHGTVKNHMLLDRYMQLVNSLYGEPKEEVMSPVLTKTQLPAYYLHRELQYLRLKKKKKKKKKTVKKKARKDGNNGVDIRQFFAAKERVMLNNATHSKRNNNSIYVIYIVTVFNHKAKQIFTRICAFLSSFLEFLSFSLFYCCVIAFLSFPIKNFKFVTRITGRTLTDVNTKGVGYIYIFFYLRIYTFKTK